MSESAIKFDVWALVELFGHQRVVGRVTEQTIGAAAMIRVDVPDVRGNTRFTRFYGNAAVYAISPIDRDTAIRLAQAVEAEPVHQYELPKLTAGTQNDDGYESDPEEDEP